MHRLGTLPVASRDAVACCTYVHEMCQLRTAMTVANCSLAPTAGLDRTAHKRQAMNMTIR